MIELILSIAIIALTIEIVLLKKESKGYGIAKALGAFTGIIIGLFIRLLVFPFACALILIASLRQWLCLSLDYLLTGGEMIIFKNLANKKTIHNYLEELTKNK